MSAGVLRTDNLAGGVLKEDLLDEVTMISPVETPLFSNMGMGNTATQSIHEWTNDEIARETSVEGAAEGADAEYSDLDNPTRSVNFVQEIQKTFKVSWKSRKSDTAGGDPYSYQQAKAMKKWKLQSELSILKGSGLSGASGSGWVMKGLYKAIQTNFYSAVSGTTLTEDIYNDVLELAYADVEDDDFDSYVPIGIKRKISGFTSTVTRNMDADEARLIRKVDIYESDVFSVVRIYKHRDLTETTNMNFVNIQPRYFKKSFMEGGKPSEHKLAQTGANDKGMIWGSMTMEFRQEKAGVLAFNLN